MRTKKSFKDHFFEVFTGKDNASLDMGRILWAMGVLVFFALSIHSVWHGNVFDPIAWGSGFGAILASGGAALWMKQSTEPGTTTSVKISDKINNQNITATSNTVGS